jgi:hypothetical protein
MQVVPKTNWYLFGLRTAQMIVMTALFWFGTAGLVTVTGWPGWGSAVGVVTVLSVLNWFLITPAVKTLAAYLYVRWQLQTDISLKEARQLAPHLNRDIGAAEIDAKTGDQDVSHEKTDA